MSDVGELGIVVRPTDAKVRHQQYDDGVKRRALLYYCAGINDGEIERLMGLTKSLPAKWRERRQPGGVDWDKLKATWDVAPLDQVLGLVGPVDEVEAREGLVRLSQKLLGLGMATLEEGPLYNSAGGEVKFLFDRKGKKVPVGGMRPRTVSELARLIEVAAKIQIQQVEALEEKRIRDVKDGHAAKRWLAQMLAAVEQKAGKGVRAKVEAALAAGEDAEVKELEPGNEETTEEVETDGKK